MRFAFLILPLLLSAAPALAEAGRALREPDAQERAAVEAVLRANLPEGARLLGADMTLAEVEAGIGRACGHARVEGRALPYAVAVGWSRQGEPLGVLISMDVDQMGPQAAIAACAAVGVTL